MILIPAIVLWCLRVHRHYQQAREELAPEPGHDLLTAGAPPARPNRVEAEHQVERQDLPAEIDHLVVVPVAALDLAGLRALAYAASLPVPVLAVHVSPRPEEDERFRRYWRIWGEHLPLQVVISPLPGDGGAPGQLHRGAARPAPGRHADCGRARGGPQAQLAAAASPSQGGADPPDADPPSPDHHHQRPAFNLAR